MSVYDDINKTNYNLFKEKNFQEDIRDLAFQENKEVKELFDKRMEIYDRKLIDLIKMWGDGRHRPLNQAMIDLKYINGSLIPKLL